MTRLDPAAAPGEASLRFAEALMPPILIAFALLAEAPQAPVPPAPPAAKPKLVCREGEQALGTHVRTGRRCKTAEQWEAEDSRSEPMPLAARATEGQQDGHPSQRPQ
jgi:hypothetical protein